MFTIKNDKKNYSVDYPTELGEISNEYFDKMLSDIHLQEHYCVVALCFKDKLFNIVTALKQRTSPTSNVVPIIAKIADNNECNYKQGERVVTDRTNLERGIHLPIAKNTIGVTGFENYVKDNQTLMTELMNRKGDSIYMVEFKIMPIRDIVATRDRVSDADCIFTVPSPTGVLN